MGLINVRELLKFPEGDNSTDTVVNGVHFDLAALEKFNYTIYSNGTISNRTKCFLVFEDYQPLMLANGSWINGTSCYFPYYGIKTRGKLSITFATLFCVTIMFTLINLRKHGKRYMRENKRFRIVGRRWQWYWMCFVAASGMISCITGVDVDRNYLPSTPIILQSLFFSLTLPGTLAVVWEATRHWGSWQERQIYERDPFLLNADDRRGTTEFYMPLVFYLFGWLNFFMVIPRGWTKLEYQRSPEQQDTEARPSGTDARIKAGSVLAICAWAVIIFSLQHSIKHYKLHEPGVRGRINAIFVYTPAKIFFSIIVLGVRLAYSVISAWRWEFSLFKTDVNPIWPFALGYLPTVIILIIFEVAGFFERNEDLTILEQKRLRDDAANTELGIVKRPSWWHGSDAHMSDEQRMKKLTSEVGASAKKPSPAGHLSTNMELQDMKSLRNRSRTRESDGDGPFRDRSPPPQASTTTTTTAGLTLGERTGSTARSRQHLIVDRKESDATSVMSGGTETSARSENKPPQRVRSMLDV